MGDLDLCRLHQVALGARRGRGCGATTLFLVNVVHAVWGGEERLVSIQLVNPPGGYGHYSDFLIGELGRVCRWMGEDYRKTGIGQAQVGGVPVRIHVNLSHGGRGTAGIGNCSVVEEGPDWEEILPVYDIHEDRFLCL
jgi:hypothetical protein